MLPVLEAFVDFFWQGKSSSNSLFLLTKKQWALGGTNGGLAAMKKAPDLALFSLVLERLRRRRFGIAFFIFFIDHAPNVFDRFPLIVSGDRFSGDLEADAAFGRMVIPDDRAVWFIFIDKAIVIVFVAGRLPAAAIARDILKQLAMFGSLLVQDSHLFFKRAQKAWQMLDRFCRFTNIAGGGFRHLRVALFLDAVIGAA